MARRKRTSPKRLKWLNPEVALHLGYCVYIAGDNSSAKDTPRWQLACREARRLGELSAEPGSPEDNFLMQTRAIIVSYAGAIARHKRILTDELAEAQLEHDDHQKRIAGSRFQSALWAAAAKAGMMGLLFAIGFAFAKTLAPFIPTDIGGATGTMSPSFLSGLIFILAGRWISMYYWDYRQQRIINRLNERIDAAWELFGGKRISEYRQHLADLIEVWNSYTGRKYKVVSSIEEVLKDDLYSRRLFVRRKKVLSRGDLEQIVSILWAGFRRLRHRDSSHGPLHSS